MGWRLNSRHWCHVGPLDETRVVWFPLTSCLRCLCSVLLQVWQYDDAPRDDRGKRDEEEKSPHDQLRAFRVAVISPQSQRRLGNYVGCARELTIKIHNGAIATEGRASEVSRLRKFGGPSARREPDRLPIKRLVVVVFNATDRRTHDLSSSDRTTGPSRLSSTPRRAQRANYSNWGFVVTARHKRTAILRPFARSQAAPAVQILGDRCILGNPEACQRNCGLKAFFYTIKLVSLSARKSPHHCCVEIKPFRLSQNSGDQSLNIDGLRDSAKRRRADLPLNIHPAAITPAHQRPIGAFRAMSASLFPSNPGRKPRV